MTPVPPDVQPPLDSVTAVVRAGDERLLPKIRAIMSGYADRPAMAWRERTASLSREYTRATYGELWSASEALAAAWAGDSRTRAGAGSFVATLGFTSPDHTRVDLAVVRLGGVAVPLPSAAPADQLVPVIAEAEPLVLATSEDRLPAAVAAVLATTSVRRVVVFDTDTDTGSAAVEEARAALACSPVVLTTLAEDVALGSDLPPAPEPEWDTDDPLALLVYTSGSTGAPKGAMYTERRVSSLWANMWGDPDAGVTSLVYLPMSHALGRTGLFSVFTRGGTAHFAASADQSTLLEDLSLTRPTELLLVPRVCELLHQHHRSLVDKGMSEEAAGAALRDDVLGGRVAGATCGSAPLSAELGRFMTELLGFDLRNGYGSTEAGMITADNRVLRPPVLDYKLVDVPELGYYTTDSPHPRGELLLKSLTTVPGYYKRPELNAQTFDDDGFYRTGDIMAEVAPDELVHVDRRKNVLKLAQGEFVAVAHLESVFAASPLVHQVYVYGSSERSFLLAVVVPTEDALAKHGAGVRERVLDSFRGAELNSYEIPRDIIIEPTPFSLAEGLLSDSNKQLRPRLRDKYGQALEDRYTELARGEQDGLRELRRTGHERPVVETVGRAAHALLGTAGSEPTPTARFIELGGDSLSALAFSRVLHDIFGVEVPVSVVISPANDLAAIAAHITAGAARPTASGAHGPGGVHARDLTLDKFIDPETRTAAPGLPAVTGPPNTVLLTGANGYLGRFLCLEWLERLAPTNGTLLCVVRGTDAESARARLDTAFDSGDPELLHHYRALADNLTVLAGDIGEHNLGLDHPTWTRLAETVDLIVHPAALVNHMLPYDQLFGPNVTGTAELIRLAITTRVKPITYLSTVAVLHPGFTEDADARTATPTRPVDETYANGYATSKWAGEVLLREAHDLCGLPVRVFRSDMILAHTRYTGQLNTSDMITRLLFSVLATGLAPASFYTSDSRAHYDGLPVDFTAKAITTLGSDFTGYRSFNTLNPHADGHSLDLFMTWLADAGHPIHRIPDYDDWLRRLEQALRTLPEHKRRHSLLPLMQAFAEPATPVDGPSADADGFRAAVLEATGEDVPQITPELVVKYASDLKALEVL
ncbi:carboxylic acid reductase [Actinokineospora pegani]|uniref:carboxylic acid reductase n=1 Tax=Actinokineospora pegani TaxID=2654637 RepID=UPI0018D4D27A|nr:carboxylic acid reductase [Actinokineospora pegani]